MRLTIGVSVLLAALSVAWVFRLSNHGMDLTDESFYLVWMANPFAYPFSATQFGFVYHPLYVLLGGDVSALRQVNCLITYVLSFLLTAIFLRAHFPGLLGSRWERYAISAVMATAGLMASSFSGLWLPTPSYNSLALQAVLLAAIGLLLSEKRVALLSVTGWALLGIGGALTFLAKPPAAVALAVLAATFILLTNRADWRLGAVTLFAAIVVVAASGVAIDGTLPRFVERLQAGAEAAAILGGGHSAQSAIRLDVFGLDHRDRVVLAILVLALSVPTILTQRAARTRSDIWQYVSWGLLLSTFLMIFDIFPDVLRAGSYHGLLLISIPVASTIVLLWLRRSITSFNISRVDVYEIVFFLLLPFVYAFGTNNNYWILAQQAGLSWVLAGLLILKPLADRISFRRTVATFALAVQLVVVGVVQAAMERPYRQPESLRNQAYPTEIGAAQSRLYLSQEFALYLDQMSMLARAAGFATGMPLIDLTGKSPGVSYALGARSPGLAWIIGGYPGSNRLAAKAMQTVSCKDAADAWVLTEPSGSTSISVGVLGEFGGDLEKDYAKVGELMTPAGAGEYDKPRLQRLYKPIRSYGDAFAACTAAKGAKL